MGVVFLVLIILSVAIYGLGKLDQMTGSAAGDRPESETTPVSATAGSTVSPEIVAVIGAALAMAQADTVPAEPGGLTSGSRSSSDPRPEGWLSSGLARQMASRTRELIRRNR